MSEQNPIFRWFDSDEESKDVSSQTENTQSKEMEAPDLLFAKKFNALGGKFIYCESLGHMFALLESLKEQMNWNYVFAWTHELRNLMLKFDFQQGEIGFLMDNSDAAISFCDSLIADSGVIMLSPDQATNRRLTTFPPHHIIVANRKSLVDNLEGGIERFSKNFYNRLPSIIELDQEKKVYKENHSRVLNADGTKDVYVFYIDVDRFE